MSFGDLVKEIRRELSISQEQLAHDLNISFSTINRWENGKTSPSKLAKHRLHEYCISKNITKNITEKFNK
ncbi:helix-turn-helix domain-containing protein [Desulfitibacter alkalitolerans]|jgi:transcriptional regulator with XRE-family HTH domain|uniref:helix-turn-helix domain-containing protein n=1 Tax=Desulfitibacter alkalitolerans TaxID=264641 RepID=UPI0005511BAC|nr:helix-turn-helix transcriptional regulator [Desulfitibacter alkalitolerans]